MKTKTKRSVRLALIALSVLAVCLVLLASCTVKPAVANGTAAYTSDTELGSGSKTLTVSVTDNENKTVKFTIRTDKSTVGDALAEHNLIAGDEGEYGLYVKTVNGIRADYDTDGAYWGFFRGGEMMMTGVDGTEFADGDSYELVYTK